MRRLRLPTAAPALIAVVGGVVLTAATIALVLGLRSTGGHGRAVDVLRASGSLPTPEPSVTVAPSLPVGGLPTSALPVPATTATSGQPAATSTGAPTRVTDPYCGSGGLPPGMHSDAACDVGKHTGMPTDCEVFHGCAWPDSWGATPAGPIDTSVRAQSSDVVVSWRSESEDLTGDRNSGPVHEFVVRLYRGTTQLRQYEVGLGYRSLTMRAVPPGDYGVWVMELNDSGLSAGMMNYVTVPKPASPSPSPSSTPSPTPTPTPTPTATST